MTPSEETLMAYVDGELDEQARSEVEAAIRANPEVAARVARQQALRQRVHLAFARVAAEKVPDRLVAAARGASASSGESNVVPLRRKSARQWSWPEWGSIAASLGAGAVLSILLLRHSDGGLVSSRNGQLFANGVLAQALSGQLASTQGRASIQIGVSFRDKRGDYCRTFNDAKSLAGLACRDGDRWRLDVLARNTGGGDSASAPYRPAASSIPSPILQSVEDRIAGDPLDAQGEAAAKSQGWTR